MIWIHTLILDLFCSQPCIVQHGITPSLLRCKNAKSFSTLKIKQNFFIALQNLRLRELLAENVVPSYILHNGVGKLFKYFHFSSVYIYIIIGCQFDDCVFQGSVDFFQFLVNLRPVMIVFMYQLECLIGNIEAALENDLP